jgi:hypothetical protein
MEENKILAGNPANTVKGARREEKEPNILELVASFRHRRTPAH